MLAGSDEGESVVLHGGMVARLTVVVFCCGLRQTGQKNSFSVGAAFAALEGVVERSEELEPSLDSRVVVPYFADAL